ncbi:hypothetical protein EUTSA_v10022975mg [Eutrema salsugineum]|uniref:Uncharacterized protein n=1 Tax=Eutrema salsugineum TaxID=72664 RepID=V4MDH3_EUTSA|nr:hypothetical protein EUTSA_v10022975mg [Eutrema salsugineum]
MGRSDTRRLDYHVVDETGYYQKVGEENQSVYGHRRRKRERWDLETETRWSEKGEREDSEKVEHRIDRGLI